MKALAVGPVAVVQIPAERPPRPGRNQLERLESLVLASIGESFRTRLIQTREARLNWSGTRQRSLCRNSFRNRACCARGVKTTRFGFQGSCAFQMDELYAIDITPASHGIPWTS